MRKYLGWILFLIALIAAGDALAGHGHRRGHARSRPIVAVERGGGAAVCGDGNQTGAEACDDSNLLSWDGCSSSCTLEHPAASIADVTMFFDAAYSAHQYQEQGGSGIPVSVADTDADTVGQVQDPALGNLAQALSDATRPVLRSDGAISYWEFENGTNQKFQVATSQDIVNHFYEDGLGSITMYMRKRDTQDGILCHLVDSGFAVTTNPGIGLRLTAANAVQFIVDPGDGATVFNHTSTFTLEDTTGWQILHVSINNASNGSMVLGTPGDYAGRTSEVMTRANAPAAEAGGTDRDLTIGTRAGSASGSCDVDIAWIVFTSSAMSAGDLQTLFSHAPARTSNSLLTCERGAAAGFCNFVSHHYDFTSEGSLWQDRTGRTTAVSVSTDPIGTVANLVGSAELLRDAVSPGDTQRALWQDDGTGADFDGSNDEYDFAAVQRGGGITWIWVMRNDDLTDGSRPLNGSLYTATSGDDYAGNAARNGVAYFSTHPASGGSAGSCDLGTETGFNVGIIARDGSAFSQYVRGNQIERVGDGGTSAVSMVLNNIGDAADALWEMDGRIAEIFIIQAALTEAQQNAIVDELATKHSGLDL